MQLNVMETEMAGNATVMYHGQPLPVNFLFNTHGVEVVVVALFERTRPAI